MRRNDTLYLIMDNDCLYLYVSGEWYSRCCSDSSKSHSFSCESPSPGLHARTKDYKEGPFLIAYKSNIRAWVQTVRRILQWFLSRPRNSHVNLSSCSIREERWQIPKAVL